MYLRFTNPIPYHNVHFLRSDTILDTLVVRVMYLHVLHIVAKFL